MRARVLRVIGSILGILVFLAVMLYVAAYFWNRHVESSLVKQRVVVVSPRGGTVSVQMMNDVKRGQYDKAVQEGVATLKNTPADAPILQDIAKVYLVRAQNDVGRREDWVRQAASWVDKALSIDPDDPVNILESADVLRAIGNISASKGCTYYHRVLGLSDQLQRLYSRDHVNIAGESYPVDPVRKEFTAAGHTFHIATLEEKGDRLVANVKETMANTGCE